MPGMYSGKDYDLAGFAVGAVERDLILPSKSIAKGDVLLGLSSSGLHSNEVFLSFANWLNLRAWTGLHRLLFALNATVAEALLEPTRIYVKPLLEAIRQTGQVKALAHITGGGFTENIPRVLPGHLGANVNLGSFAVPAVFNWLREAGGISEKEMLRTFKLRHRHGGCRVKRKVPMRFRAFLSEAGETVSVLGHLTD